MDKIEEPANLRLHKLNLILKIMDKLLLPLENRWVYRTIKKNIEDQINLKEKVPMITNTKEFILLKKSSN